MFAVVMHYSFDPEMTVCLFDTEEAACEYVKRQYAKALEAERSECEEEHTFREDKCYLCEDGSWAQICWDNPWVEDDLDTQTWNVVGVSKPED